VVADEQRSVLETLIRSQTAPHRDVQRAMALLMACDGFANTRIASEVGVSATTVMNWRERFAQNGLKNFSGVRPGRGRKPSIASAKIEQIVHGNHRRDNRATTRCGSTSGPSRRDDRERVHAGRHRVGLFAPSEIDGRYLRIRRTRGRRNEHGADHHGEKGQPAIHTITCLARAPFAPLPVRPLAGSRPASDPGAILPHLAGSLQAMPSPHQQRQLRMTSVASR
jgi:hypothetical protein